MNQLRSTALGVLFAGATVLAGCGALVGEQCRAPYSQCGRVCVDLATDLMNCGACGHACAGSAACVMGVCGGATDAGPRDGGGDGAVDAGRDAATADAAVDAAIDAPRIDAGDAGGSDAATVDAGIDAATIDAGSCAPLTDCGGICVDLTSDPDHCGTCAISCGSGLCVGGVCDTSLAGHLVVVGHDYETYRSAQSSLLANAVLLPARASVRILVWDGTATAAARNGARAAIAAGAGSRAYAITTATVAADVPTALASTDTFLVLGQTGAMDADLTMLGATWGASLDTFIHAGGVVVLLDAPSTTNAGTYQILSTAGLLTATARTEIVRPRLATVTGRAGDPVLLGVPLSYRGELHTVFFTTTDPDAIVAATQGPVVIDRTVAP